MPGTDDEQSGLDSSTPRGAARWGRLLMQCLADGEWTVLRACSCDEHSVMLSGAHSGAAWWGWLLTQCLARKIGCPDCCPAVTVLSQNDCGNRLTSQVGSQNFTAA